MAGWLIWGLGGLLVRVLREFLPMKIITVTTIAKATGTATSRKTTEGTGLLAGDVASVEPGDFPACGGGGGGLVDTPAPNSGKAEAGFHSVVPSAWTLVLAAMRPSATQARIVARSAGPYSWPSFPMTL
jgi:hypothetical protein